MSKGYHKRMERLGAEEREVERAGRRARFKVTQDFWRGEGAEQHALNVRASRQQVCHRDYRKTAKSQKIMTRAYNEVAAFNNKQLSTAYSLSFNELRIDGRQYDPQLKLPRVKTGHPHVHREKRKSLRSTRSVKQDAQWERIFMDAVRSFDEYLTVSQHFIDRFVNEIRAKDKPEHTWISKADQEIEYMLRPKAVLKRKGIEVNYASIDHLKWLALVPDEVSDDIGEEEHGDLD